MRVICGELKTLWNSVLLCGKHRMTRFQFLFLMFLKIYI